MGDEESYQDDNGEDGDNDKKNRKVKLLNNSRYSYSGEYKSTKLNNVKIKKIIIKNQIILIMMKLIP